MKLHVICVFLACVSLVWTNAVKECDEIPGLTVRMQNKFLDSMKEQVSNFLNLYLKSLLKFKKSLILGCGLKTWSMKSWNFDFGNLDILLSSPKSFELDVSKTSVRLTNDFELETDDYVLSRWFTHLGKSSISGSMYIGFNFSQAVQFLRIAQGQQPQLIATSCLTSIEDLEINLTASPGMEPLMNGMNGILSNAKGFGSEIIEAAICSLVKTWVPTLGFLGIDNVIDEQVYNSNTSPIKIHHKSVCDPMATEDGLTIYLKGIASPNEYPEQAFPFVASPVPKLTPTSQLARASISEYSINTMFYSMWKQNWFDVKFPFQVISTETGSNFGGILPCMHIELSPDFIEKRPILIQLSAPKAPAIKLTQNTVVLSGNFMLKAKIVLENGELESTFDDVVTNFNATFHIVTENHSITVKPTDLEALTSQKQGLIAQNINAFPTDICHCAISILLKDLHGIINAIFVYEDVTYKLVNRSVDIKKGALEVGI